MIKIELLGELGKKFGDTHVLDIKTTSEAVRALTANFKDFRTYMEGSEKNGVGYRLISNEEDIDIEEIHNPVSKSIKIVPVMMGAGNGITKIVLGAALIAASIYLPGSQYAWSSIAAFDTAAMIATAASTIGTALVIQGTSQLLSPLPKAPNYGGNDERSPSYLYNGAVNTTVQGNPVPIGYGRLIIGSAVISAGSDAVDIKVA
jgi:predicted phage tail protein